MKTIYRRSVAFFTLVLVSSQTLASSWSWESIFERLRQIIETYIANHADHTAGGSAAVPEMDVLNAGIAVALTACLIAIARELRKR